MPATALVLCLIVTDLHSPVVVLIYSVDAIASQVLVALLLMQSVPDSIIYGFPIQNPAQPLVCQKLGKALELYCFSCLHKYPLGDKAFHSFHLLQGWQLF